MNRDRTATLIAGMLYLLGMVAGVLSTAPSVDDYLVGSVEAMAMPAKHGQPLDAHLLDPPRPHRFARHPIDVTCRTLRLLPDIPPTIVITAQASDFRHFQAGALEREAIERMLGSRTYV